MAVLVRCSTPPSRRFPSARAATVLPSLLSSAPAAVQRQPQQQHPAWLNRHPARRHLPRRDRVRSSSCSHPCAPTGESCACVAAAVPRTSVWLWMDASTYYCNPSSGPSTHTHTISVCLGPTLSLSVKRGSPNSLMIGCGMCLTRPAGCGWGALLFLFKGSLFMCGAAARRARALPSKQAITSIQYLIIMLLSSSSGARPCSEQRWGGRVRRISCAKCSTAKLTREAPL